MGRAESEVKTLICKIEKSIDNYEAKSRYYRFGVEYFGPFLYGYIQWLYNEVVDKKYSKIFFLSRDGYMMYEAFKIFNSKKILDISYVYFSRKSLRQALLHTCTSYEESLKYLTHERYITIGKLLEYYGFSHEECKNIARDEELDLEENLVFAELKINCRMKELYKKYSPLISDISKYQDEMLKQYLKKINMCNKCAIVDIGWHGSMQFYLEEYFKYIGQKVELFGYYVGVNPTPLLKSNNYGWLYNKDDLSLRKDVLCFFGGYEKLFQSCEGSTDGYNIKKEGVEPILIQYEYAEDDRLINHIKEWQKGAMKFVQEAYRQNASLNNERIWAYPLIRFGKKPTNTDVKLLSFLYNTDGSKIYYVSNKPLYKYKPKEFIHALSNSVWKTGFLKSVFKLPLPYYQVYRLLRK